MGGIGSGSWERTEAKSSTGECHSVDVRYLHRHGLLKPGHRFSLSWSRAGKGTGSIGGVVPGGSGDKWPERVILVYRHRQYGREWEDVRESVELSWTACNFGGARPWFVCPGARCGRRVAVLYGPGCYFLCRHCHDLRYESQRKSSGDRALHRAQEIRRRLGGSANMTLPFPERPKGMHHGTYNRLRWEHDIASDRHMEALWEHLDKFHRQLDRRLPGLWPSMRS